MREYHALLEHCNALCGIGSGGSGGPGGLTPDTAIPLYGRAHDLSNTEIKDGYEPYIHPNLLPQSSSNPDSL